MMSLLQLNSVILVFVLYWLPATANTVVTCKTGALKQILDCDKALIRVQSVEAGHRETDACVDGIPPLQTLPPLCNMTGTLQHMQRSCTGRKSCMFSMGHCDTACMRRCLYMRTTYTCTFGALKHVCQKHKAVLYCGDEVIKMLRANYGRLNQKRCRYKAPRRFKHTEPCRTPNALKEMSRRCDGKHKCSVRASNHVFTNPCPGVRKYLQYSYICVPASKKPVKPSKGK